MRTTAVFDWSDTEGAERTPVPAHLVRFIENYENDSIEFGFDAHDHAEQMLDAVRDQHFGIDDCELAGLAIADTF